MALVNPHGSQKKLMPLLLKGAERDDEIGRAKAMKKINISSRESGDILMLGMGAFTPLNGFMCKDDYDGCVEEMKLRKVDPGTMWPLPVTLAVDEDVRKEINEGDEVALHDSETGELMATMKIEEIWEPDKRKECELCFKGAGPDSERFWEVAEEEHPGVQQVLNSGKYYVGGPIKALSEKDFKQKYGDAYMHPNVSRQIFEDRGWSTVAAFQTRNPIHRSHEIFREAVPLLVRRSASQEDRLQEPSYPYCSSCQARPYNISFSTRRECHQVSAYQPVHE